MDIWWRQSSKKPDLNLLGWPSWDLRDWRTLSNHNPTEIVHTKVLHKKTLSLFCCKQSNPSPLFLQDWCPHSTQLVMWSLFSGSVTIVFTARKASFPTHPGAGDETQGLTNGRQVLQCWATPPVLNSISIFMYLFSVWVNTIVHMWHSKDSLQESVFFSYLVGLEISTQVEEMGSKCLYPLNYLIKNSLHFLTSTEQVPVADYQDYYRWF